MSVERAPAWLYFLLTAYCASMHGMPCSALNHCFGGEPSDGAPDQMPSHQGPDGSSRRSRGDPGGLEPPGAEPPVLRQPEPKACGGAGGGVGGGPVAEEYSPGDWRCESCTSARSAPGRTDRSGSRHSRGDAERCGSPRTSSFSQSSEEDFPDEVGSGWAPEYPLIPRPSIIIRQPGVSEPNTAYI